MLNPPPPTETNPDAAASLAGHPEVPSRQPSFFRGMTGLSAIVLGVSLLIFGWLHLTIPPVARVTAPQQALTLTVGRSMDFEEALPSVTRWEQFVYRSTMQNGADQLEQAIGWYTELAAYTNDPGVYLQLTILEGEAGHLERVRRAVARWTRQHPPFPTYAAWIQAAYLEESLPPQQLRTWREDLADVLPPGWFYDKLVLRLADREGDEALKASTTEALMTRGFEGLNRVRIFVAVDLILILMGAVAAVPLFRHPDPNRLRVSSAAVPPPWSGRGGMAVIVRGGAIGALLTWASLFADVGESALRLLALPAINLPLLMLAWRDLLRPGGLTFRDAFGLRPHPSRWPQTVQVMAILLAAGFAGEWVIGFLGEGLGLSSHWTEWFDADLVWGDAKTVATSFLEYVLYAPLFEELLFRALLFATLRRKFGIVTSALLSAGTFGLAHGYGLLGFASVMWSGLLWAWAYEKTGSILPGILAHAINNIIVCLTIIAMLRL